MNKSLNRRKAADDKAKYASNSVYLTSLFIGATSLLYILTCGNIISINDGVNMLLTVILILSLLICVLLAVRNIVRLVWLPLIFIGSVVGLFLIWIGFCFICTRFIDLDKPCTIHSPFFRWCSNVCLDFVMTFFRIDVEITGAELLPKDKFMLAGNHRSVFDPMIAMLYLSSYNMGFVAKKEVCIYPIFNRLMHKCFCLPLDRSSLKSEARTIKAAANLIKSQTASIGIYPEGQRNTDDEMLPFMTGAFSLAKKADCPIVVTLIKGTDKIIKNFFTLRRSKVRMEYAAVIDRETVRCSSTAQLSEATREMLTVMYLKQ